MPGDLTRLTARELAAAIAGGEATAVEALASFRARIDAHDGSIGAYRCRADDRADREAHAVDEARTAGAPLGPLAGVPMGLKDIFVTAGVPTTCGSKVLEGWTPPYEGTAAARLHDAGAVLLGKHAMDEFAMGSSNENSAYAPVCNPWSLDHVPGGSSGGSAAAVAAGLAAFALGTDTGGSIRQPAALCGIVGLKPSYGRVTRAGMIAFASSLDQGGPMTRDVRDAALVLSVIAGADPSDATCLDAPVPDFVAACDRGLAGLRVGVHRAAMDRDGLDDEVRASFDAGLATLRDGGATIVDVELPHSEQAIATYYVLSMAEAASNLARYDGVRYGPRAAGDSLDTMIEATRDQGFGPEVKRRILLGTFVQRKGSYEAYYGRAMKVRSMIAQGYRDAFSRCDVIASPTSPVAGFKRGERVDDPLTMYLSDVFTIGANLAGLPAISVPAGFSSSPRLPIGLQFTGRALDEQTVLAAAAGFEDATAWHRERPAMWEATP
ncbi:MAG: Asp-tRNA(Asn)/Glu-tRNA(Gln) amidotransferase subunit GatA [Myxococcota bacterium]